MGVLGRHAGHHRFLQPVRVAAVALIDRSARGTSRRRRWGSHGRRRDSSGVYKPGSSPISPSGKVPLSSERSTSGSGRMGSSTTSVRFRAARHAAPIKISSTTRTIGGPVAPYAGAMDDLQVGRWTIPADELEERFETSGGPGGQHANRSETAVRIRFSVPSSSLPDDVKEKLTHRLGDNIEASSADTRSQFRNRAMARRRLKEKIETALVEQPVRRRTWPTRASRIRRIESKKARGAIKRLRRRPNGHD